MATFIYMRAHVTSCSRDNTDAHTHARVHTHTHSYYCGFLKCLPCTVTFVSEPKPTYILPETNSLLAMT